VKILIDIVCRNAVGEDALDGKYLLVCTKSYEPSRIPLALKIARIYLACINDFVEQKALHSVLAAKDLGWICGYLSEVILHEKIVPNSVVPGDAQPPHG
jgi:hypothetical protein